MDAMEKKMYDKVFDDLCESQELCGYCARTDYGRMSAYQTPNGVVMCEGRYCEEAFQVWLEENE